MPDPSISDLGLTADLHAEPWRYPGPFLPFSCLQIDDRLLPFPPHPGDLLHRHAIDLAERHFVIAYGSNASPDVVCRKFRRAGITAAVPHLLARLDGVALGHSAHVSRAGYVPLTSYPHARSSVPVVASALTSEQLRHLDQTERNYDRIRIPATRLHLSLPQQLPRHVHLYESTWGAITDSPGKPLPFGPQSAVFNRLAQWGLLPPPLVVTSGIRHITTLLGRQAELREWIRDQLARRSTRLSGQKTAQ